MNNDENSALVPRAGLDRARSLPFDPGLESAPPPASRSALPLRALWRYRWSILGVTIAMAAGGLIALGLFLEPVYKSIAILEVKPAEAYVDTVVSYRSIGNDPQAIMTHVAIMRRDPDLRKRVVALPDVKATRWYQSRPSFFQRLLDAAPPPEERLGTDMTIEPEEKNTSLIRVAATVPSASDAQILADAVAQEYVTLLSERYTEEDRKRIRQLTEDKIALKSTIDNLEIDIEERCRLSGAISEEQIVDHGRPPLDTVVMDAALLDFEILQLQARLDNLGKLDAAPASQPDAVVSSNSRYRADPTWTGLKANELAAENKLNQLSEQFGDESPTRDNLKRALGAARRQLKEHEQKLDQQYASGEVLPRNAPTAEKDFESDPKALRLKLDAAKAKREFFNVLRRDFNDDSNKRVTIALEIKSKRAELNEKLDRLKQIEAKLTLHSDKIKMPAPVSQRSKAVIPTLPDNDKRIKFAAAILAAAVAAGVGLALLRIRLAPQVQELADIEPAISGAFVCNLPLGARAMAENPLDWPAYTEAVRVLRTSLLARLGTDRCRVLQIASGGPGSGKSTLAAGLARSFADCGKRILLIDADFRRPSLSRRFADATQPGLVNVLALPAPDDSSIRATAWPGVSLLSAGIVDSPSNIDGIANGRFRAALDRWRQRFDLIVIDSPPMLASADAAILSTHVDGTLMVVRERHCHRRDLIESLAALGAAGGRLLGTVFVGSLVGRSYGYGYGYGYGYKYRDDADIRANDAIDDRAPLS